MEEGQHEEWNNQGLSSSKIMQWDQYNQHGNKDSSSSYMDGNNAFHELMQQNVAS